MVIEAAKSESKISIAFVVNQIRPTGPIFVVRDIIAGLPKGVYIPYIIQLCSLEPQGEAMADQLQSLGCSIIELGFSKGQLELFSHSASYMLDDCLQYHHIDIVHSHSYQADNVTKHLVNKYMVLTTQHNISKEDFCYSKGLCLGTYMYHRQLRSLHKHCYVVGVSHTCSKYYREELPARVSVYTAQNGVDNALFCPAEDAVQKRRLREELSLPIDGYILVMSGSLVSRKDPKTVLRALLRLKRRGSLPSSFRFVVLGAGRLEASCRRMAKPLGNQVQFIGFTDRVADYLRAGDALISASHSEGFGLNIVEALSSGCAVLTTKIPVFSELLDTLPSMQTLSFSVGNTKECAESILKASSLTFDRQEALAYGELYSREQMALRYHRIYQRLVREYL